MNTRTTQILIGAIAAIALFGGGFAAGRALAPATDTGATAGTAGGTAAQVARRGALASGAPQVFGAAGGATTGRVLSVNDGSITVEVRQPAAAGAPGASPALSSTIALVGADTRVLKTVEQEIKVSDLRPGDQVTVVGTTDANGTVSASAILVGTGALQQVLGGQRPGAGGRVPAASPSASPR